MRIFLALLTLHCALLVCTVCTEVVQLQDHGDLNTAKAVRDVEDIEGTSKPYKKFLAPSNAKTATSQLLKWAYQKGMKKKIKKNIVRVKLDGSVLGSFNVNRKQTSLILSGFQGNSNYKCQIKAKWKAGGASKWSTTSCPTPDYASDNKAGWLSLHNAHRKQYKMPSVVWDSGVANSAKSWANSLANACGGISHSSSPYGENVASQSGFSSVDSVVSSQWVFSEANCYSAGSCSCTCGHFTQVLWKTTEYIGCGTASCGNKYYFVCQYVRPGNCNGYDYTKDNSPCGPFTP